MMYKIVLNQNFIHIGVPIFHKKNKLHRLHALKTKYVLTVFFIKIIFSKNLLNMIIYRNRYDVHNFFLQFFFLCNS